MLATIHPFRCKDTNYLPVLQNILLKNCSFAETYNTMDKNSLNTNKQFMIGNGMLAFGVFAVIIIFLYMSFRFQRKADKVQTYEGVYNIELTNSFAGDSIAVYLNDSLLLDQTMPDANLKVEIKRFAEDNVLMVVDNKTDKTTPFNLNPEGSRVEVKKSGDVIYILEREADSLLE